MNENLVSILFAARNIAHKEHLKTKSYAQHMALGDFYEGIVEKADMFAESFQGKYGIMEIKTLPEKSSGDIVKTLESFVKMVEKSRENYKEDAYLLNIIDEIVACFYRTLYKLKNLK